MRSQEMRELEPPPGQLERDLRWYACYTRARHEKRVAQMFRDRGLEDFVPVARLERQWHDRRKLVDFPLFPGYVFVRTSPARFYEVRSIPSVVALVTVNGTAAAIADDEIENIRRFAHGLTETGVPAEAEPMLRPGQQVVITSGPFRDVTGVICEDRGRTRVLVGIPALGLGFSVNLPVEQVRALDEAPSSP